MKLDKVDLNLFVLFEVMYREQNVTRTAVILNLTQAATSNALNRLRIAFDDPLFIRSRDGMKPTAAADNLIVEIKPALEIFRRSIHTKRDFIPESSEKAFNVGMHDIAETLLLNPMLKTLDVIAPKVAIASFFAGREKAVDQLKAGQLDVLIDTPLAASKDLQQLTLGQMPYVVAMRKDHPLSNKKLTMNDYLAAQHIHVSSRRTGRGQVDFALQGLGKHRNLVLRLQNYSVAAQRLQDSDALWTVPASLTNSNDVYVTELPFRVEAITIKLYWYKNLDFDPAIAWLKDILTDLSLTLLDDKTSKKR